MPTKDKIAEAMRRSLPLLPGDARQVVVSLLQPANLAIVAVTLTGWLVAQFFGVGEIVDLILVIAGVFTLGFSVFTGARELYDFAKIAVNAKKGYLHLKQSGLAAALKAYRFPIEHGYMTVSQMAGEGQAIGAIALVGTIFYVSVSLGPIPRAK